MDVSFTADIDHINRGHGIVEISGKEVDIGPCSRSDIGRTVKFVESHGSIQYCVRPAYLHKISSSGNGIISTQSGHLNIGPVSQDFLRSYVDIVPHGNKAYCLTKDATDIAYPYTQYSRVSNPIEVDWFPLSSKDHNLELEIAEIRDDVAFAVFGEYSSLKVRIPTSKSGISPREGDTVSVTPVLDKLSSLPDEIEANLNRIISSQKNSSKQSSTNQSEIQPTSQPLDQNNQENSSKYQQKSKTSFNKDNIESEESVDKPDLDTLRQRASESSVENAAAGASKKTVEKTQYSRSTDIKKYVKARADGVCEGCDEPAPFNSTTGDPYLHTHHVYELSSGGSDSPNTVIALCPNCHYRVHHGESGAEYNEELKKKLKSIEDESESI